MRVTPVLKKFGKYAPGDEFELQDRTAKVLIKVGKLQAVSVSNAGYQTRMLQAAPVTGPVINGHGAVPVEPVVTTEPIVAPVEPVEPVEPEQPPADLDSETTPWDPALHVASKLKNGDGTWRKRPGAKSTSE